jgi:hypothetical protein
MLNSDIAVKLGNPLVAIHSMAIKLNKQPYGETLAEAVYHYLSSHKIIRHNHYGYCGVGFVLVDDEIFYTHFDEWDSYLNKQDYQGGTAYIGIIKRFTSAKDFVEWLAKQTDESLSGKESADSWYINNQRITKQRLEFLIND